MTNPNVDKNATRAERDECNTNVINLKGILIRQITTGIWIEPKPAYVGKVKERISLEAELCRLTGKQLVKRKNDELIELNFSNLLRELKQGN